MAATITDYQATDWATQTAPGTDEVTASITWLAGDYIVVVGGTETSSTTIATPTATGLTFQLLQSLLTASNCAVYVWVARAASNGSGAITADTGGSVNSAKGISAFVVHDSSGVGAFANIDGTTAKTISLSTTAADSAVICVLCDFNAVNDTTVDPTPATNGTVKLAMNSPGFYSAYVVQWTSQGAVATTSYGITNHTGTVDMSGIVLELRSVGVSHAIVDGTVGSGGTTSVSVPYPAVVQSGDTLVALVGNRPNANTPDDISGWNKVSATGGAGSEGAGTGTIRGTLYYKTADGTESGNLTVACTSGTSMFGRMFRFQKLPTYSWDIATVSGSDNSAGTSWSATAGSDPGITTNDILICGSINSEDTARAASEAVSATGVTFAAMSELQDSGITTGNDLGMIVSMHPATAGPSSAAPVFTMTMSGTNAANSAGVTWFFRLRANAPAGGASIQICDHHYKTMAA